VMPALSSNANQTFQPGDERVLRPIPSGRHPTIVSSPPGHAGDVTLRLQELLDELKGLLSVASNPSQSVRSQDEDIRLPALPPTAEKRTYDQMVAPDESIDHAMSLSRFRGDDDLSFVPNDQTFAPRPFYLQSRKPATRGVASPKRDLAASLPSMPLSNCVSGKCYLPPPDEGSSLLNEYLHDFNSRIPLFHPEAIYNYVRDCYSGVADRTPLCWVLAYIALGIAHRLRAVSLFAVADDTINAEFYLNKCLAVLPDLLLQEPTLPLVQALLGVSALLQTSDRSRKAPLFVSTAMRMAQDLAYNEADQGRDKGRSRENQEVYVFWIAFFMDTAMNLRAIRPNTQKLVDISAPLPNPSSADSWASISSNNYSADGEVNVFSLHASLALIQAEALEELFSVKARQRSPTLTATAFESIVLKLDIWRRTNPLADANAPAMLKSMYRSDVVHSITLEASYFETLYQLHAANALGAFTHRLDVFSPTGLRSAAGLISFEIYADAHHLLEFAALISQGNVSVTW
jgi:hypothetical protein